MRNYMVIVPVPAVFYVMAENDEVADALTPEELEDAAFAQLGKYVELDLRTANFEDATVCEGEDEDEMELGVGLTP